MHSAAFGRGATLLGVHVAAGKHTMDHYATFVTVLDTLLSIFIALSVVVALDRALFTARYAYMRVQAPFQIALHMLQDSNTTFMIL